MTYTAEQIQLSKELYEKLGVKREPKVGEWWCGDGEVILIVHEDKDTNIFAEYYKAFPLYTVEELLEILLRPTNRGEIPSISLWRNLNGKGFEGEYGVCYFNERELFSDNLKTALLKLAVEVVGGK